MLSLLLNVLSERSFFLYHYKEISKIGDQYKYMYSGLTKSQEWKMKLIRWSGWIFVIFFL